MKLKNKTRLLHELAKEASNPKDFIYYVMALQQQTAESLLKDIEMSAAHFYVLMGTLSKGAGISPKLCNMIAKGLDIDPLLLYRVISDHTMNTYMEQNKS